MYLTNMQLVCDGLGGVFVVAGKQHGRIPSSDKASMVAAPSFLSVSDSARKPANTPSTAT